LPEQLEAVSKKIRSEMPVSYRLADRATREERPHYPMRALEEALINALIHRDYYEAGAEMMFDYFSDRIEISNPGGLLGGLTIDSLENKSLRRNPLIAELFFRLGKGEKLGSGIARMKALMNEWKLPPPRFETDGNFFSITFTGPRHWVAEEKMSALAPRLSQFTEMQNQITEPFTTNAYASMLHVTQRTAQKDLQELLKKRIIRKEGKGKNTKYWFL
jgi:ATP-dependent DNA helicase RecG